MKWRSEDLYSQTYLTGSLHLFGLILSIRKLYIAEEMKDIKGQICVSWSSWDAQGFRLLWFGCRNIALSFFKVKLFTTHDWLERSDGLQIRSETLKGEKRTRELTVDRVCLDPRVLADLLGLDWAMVRMKENGKLWGSVPLRSRTGPTSCALISRWPEVC